jgi:hypothetical protein
MKTIFHLVLLAVILTALAGCAKENPAKEVLATIGDYSLYEADLVSEAELYPPAYRKTVTKEEMLNDLIRKKLMLMEAQRRGLDKKPEFLKMVQRFWEQSLLRSLMDEKSKETLSSLKGTDEEKHKEAARMMQEWADGLGKNVNIKINKAVLEKIEIK